MRAPSLRGRLLSAATAILTFAIVGTILYLRTFQFPAPTGPYPVGTSTLYLQDSARHDPFFAEPNARRMLVVQLWYPAEPSQNPIARYLRWREARLATFYGPLLSTHSRVDAPVARASRPFPVLLFGHRWNGQRTQNTVLAEELASHGYVVASIDHPGNSARVELADGTVIRGKESLEGPKGSAAAATDQIDFWNSTLQLWAADSRFVLDQLAAKSANVSDPFHSQLDTANAGAFGHSFGGAAALALCGLDPRIKAAANLDGWTFGALRDRTASEPILLFYEGVSQSRERELAGLPKPGTTEDQLDRADFAATESSLRAYGGYRLFLAGTQHMDFSDEPLLPPFRHLAYTGPTAPREINAILRATVLQFFDDALRGKAAPALEPQQNTFPELTVERWPAPLSTPRKPATP